MAHAQWREVSTSQYALSHHLDRDSVPELWRFLQEWKPQHSQVEIVLNEVKRIDSAGMVLLIHLIQHAKRQNCHIMLSFVPNQLRTLFQLSNIQPLMVEHIKN
ncbi:NTP-binding protein [Vibrio sp. 10N.286.49.B3]|uniref:STAS domain-containing protein n=1 Tax=Vibrio sp. 10N.286.49.B3 TaxID=1880855 RepID=UPI000C840F8D|nr:lipid asymmetry maintenance protein MlaB [Vibrio sp. 10N.286.49.B3]PMH42595.1 NTP-binding protein [Vibrio sp. 10N.286.49.B3]